MDSQLFGNSKEFPNFSQLENQCMLTQPKKSQTFPALVSAVYSTQAEETLCKHRTTTKPNKLRALGNFWDSWIITQRVPFQVGGAHERVIHFFMNGTWRWCMLRCRSMQTKDLDLWTGPHIDTGVVAWWLHNLRTGWRTSVINSSTSDTSMTRQSCLQVWKGKTLWTNGSRFRELSLVVSAPFIQLVIGSTLSLPRVIKFKFPLHPHQKYHITSHSMKNLASHTVAYSDEKLLYNKFSLPHIYISFQKVRRMYFFEHGSGRVYRALKGVNSD